jgi:hypothetical protein
MTETIAPPDVTPPHRRGLWQMPASIERAKAARPPKLTLVSKTAPTRPPSRNPKKPAPALVSEPATPREVKDYDDLIELLRARANELKISRETVDYVGGLPDRLSSKVLSLNHIRRIGMDSLGSFLDALCIKLIAVPDDEAFERNRHRYVKRNESNTRSANAPRKPRKMMKFKMSGAITAKMFGWPASET